jgi:hypothetical protein
MSFFFDFEESQQNVLRSWYEMRIQEETIRNQNLRQLHDSLTMLRL